MQPTGPAESNKIAGLLVFLPRLLAGVTLLYGSWPGWSVEVGQLVVTDEACFANAWRPGTMQGAEQFNGGSSSVCCQSGLHMHGRRCSAALLFCLAVFSKAVAVTFPCALVARHPAALQPPELGAV